MIAEKKDIKNIIIGILIVLIIGLGVLLGYILLIKNSNQKEGEEEKYTPTPLITPTPTITPEETTVPSPTITPESTTNPEITPTPETTPEELTNSFEYSDRNYGLASSGSVDVKGYAVVKEKVRDCGVMGDSCTEKEAVSVNDIVYFHIVEINNDELEKALKEWGYEKKDLPLGCLKDNLISYYTAADEFGPSEYDGEEEDAYKYYAKTVLLTKDLTKKITSSSEKSPITLRISKSKLTHYVSLENQCSTPITDVSLVD